MMTDFEINKRIHGIMGLCWHERSGYCGCKYCPRFLSPNRSIDEHRVDFLTWEGFGLMWEFMKAHEQWEDFVSANMGKGRNLYLISPRPFAEAMCKFFEEVK